MPTRLAAVLLATLLPVPAAPQQPGETIIRTSTRLVQVSIIAADKAGKPAADLTRDDFEVTEDGKRQQIRFFSLEKGEELGAAAKSLPAGVFSNRLEYKGGLPRSATVLLFDGLNTPAGYFGRSREQLEKFLRQTDARFRIAIYTLGRSLKVLHDFTTDTALLTKKLTDIREVLPDMAPQEWGEWMAELKQGASLDSGLRQDGLGAAAFVIEASLRREQDIAVEQKTLTTLQAIEAIARRLSVIPGRKNLVWISTAFPLAMALDTPLTLGRKGAFGPLPPVRQRTFTDEFDRAVRALNDASVAVYPVDARGLLALAGALPDDRKGRMDRLTGPAFQTENEAVMRDIARRTGGKLYFGKEVNEALPEILDHARISYTLAYYPTNGSYDGKFRQIRVKTNRPGLNLSYRAGYYAFREAGFSEEEKKAELMGAVWSPVEATAIGFDASLERNAAGAPDQRTLMIRVDGNALQFTPRESGFGCRLEMFIVQKNAEGRQVDGQFENVDFKVPELKARALQQAGFTHGKTLRLNPDASILRIVVRNESGALGSLSIRLK